MYKKDFMEKRKDPRISVSISVKLKFKDYGDLVEEYSKNISEGGIFIKTEEACNVGNRLKMVLSILLDQAKTIETEGEVIWVLEPDEDKKIDPGIGVKFKDLSNEGKELIAKIIKFPEKYERR